MPCDYRKYPKDWKKRVRRILVRAGNKCERCGVKNHARGFRDPDGKFFDFADGPVAMESVDVREGQKIIRIVLTTAHLDRTGDPDSDGPLDCPDDRLQALCQRCHLHLDNDRHRIKLRRGHMARKAVGSLFEEATHA